MEHSGQTYTGSKSIFRGAVSFGGSDAAQSLADLCYKVYNGESGTDYQPRNAEAIGVWYGYENDGIIKDTLACLTVDEPEGTPVKGFDMKAMLENVKTTIKWQDK